MSFSRVGIGERAYELGKSVLLLSALAIGAKAWNVDLTSITVFDVPVSHYGANVLLGMLGLVLWVAWAAYGVARIEQTIDGQVNEDTQRTIREVTKSWPLSALLVLTMPLTIFVYSAPWVLGLVAAWVIRGETLNALKFIVHHL